ncbi:hypothetical protein [Microbacterium tumbae]
MNDLNQRLAGLRGWVSRDDDRRERERNLPKALCRRCGGIAKAGEGSRDVEPVTGLVALPGSTGRVAMRRAAVSPKDTDQWRRECQTCATATLGQMLSGVLGTPVSEADAPRVVGRLREWDEIGFPVPLSFTAEGAGIATGRPWGHVSLDQRDEVRRVHAEVVRERVAGPCTQGACGLCGRREAIRWYEGPSFMKWPDGSPAPVCGPCQEVLDRRPEVLGVEDLRVRAVEAATGFAQAFYMAPDDFRCYYESRAADGNGFAEPWTYGDGIVSFVDAVWEDRPNLAPVERRDEFRARLQTRLETARRVKQEKLHQAESVAW